MRIEATDPIESFLWGERSTTMEATIFVTDRPVIRVEV